MKRSVERKISPEALPTEKKESDSRFRELKSMDVPVSMRVLVICYILSRQQSVSLIQLHLYNRRGFVL
jgi:hypothetical protein